MRDTVLQSSPFILGSIEEHRMGVYKLKVFRRQSGTVDTWRRGSCCRTNGINLYNFVSDFQKWHCGQVESSGLCD